MGTLGTTEPLQRTLLPSRGSPLTRPWPGRGTTPGPCRRPTGGRTGESHKLEMGKRFIPSFSRSRLTDPSPSRHSYHDSAYSSHSSQSSDPSAPSAFSVIQSPTTTLARPALSNQSSPSKVSLIVIWDQQNLESKVDRT